MPWLSRQRRSSSSRRARNLALLGSLVTGGVIVTGLLLLFGRFETSPEGGIRGVALDGIAPVWTIIRLPVDVTEHSVDWVEDYFRAVSRNRQLETENRYLRRLAERNIALERQNLQLKRLLHVVEPTNRWSRAFPVSGASSGSYVQSAVISGGQAEGVRIGQPVRSTEGLVGRIIEVGRHAARVLLLTDANSRIPVRIVRNGKPAMVSGANAAQLEVRFLAADAHLQVGDRLVTSGDGGIFPPDIPVAIVTHVDNAAPLARPFTDLIGLGYVIVEQPYLPPITPLALTPATEQSVR